MLIGVEHDDCVGQSECSVDVVEGLVIGSVPLLREVLHDHADLCGLARQTECLEEHAKRHVQTRILERERLDECFQHLKSHTSISVLNPTR